MNAGIFFNRRYFDENVENVKLIRQKFTCAGHSCKVINGFEDLDGLDVLFVLGGDGTILLVASECARRGVKIIGINYGHMGFLAEFEPEKLAEAAELVLSGDYPVQKRSMLKISFGDSVCYALNDLVVQRNNCGEHFVNTVNLRAEIDGATVDNFSADGIIVSTPTGSTAYSLSAGGSVLAPELEAFILTPVCAHSLHSRPVVFSDKSDLTISPLGHSQGLVMAVDGKLMESYKGQSIKVAKAAYPVEFITRGDKNFFNKLLIKLNIWSK